MTGGTIRCYSDLIRLEAFSDRYEYLKLDGSVGVETFGYDRYLNQRLYHSAEWRAVRDWGIARDMGRELGVEGYEIHGRIYIHHMNPITQDDIARLRSEMFDPEFLICVSHNTHNAIHYSDASLLITEPIERRPDDTCPWKRHNR